MPTSQQIPGCGDRAWNWRLSCQSVFTTNEEFMPWSLRKGWGLIAINCRSSRKNGIVTRQPCRVVSHLVT
eukprot:6105517-Pleurochrysis_carterae.AAC.1